MASVDKREAYRRASAALEARRPADALPSLWSLVDRSHLVDEELAGYLRMMGQAYAMLGLSRAAATIHLFLGEVDAAWRLSQNDPTDLARCAVMAGRPKDAAQAYERAGWFGHAAIQLEEATDHRAARVLWERLADDVRLRDELYTQGLVRFNLGRACARLGDKAAARRATVQSMHLLEAAADGFETRGLRERAFDCYQVLLTLGREGAFENLAEGYLNCIRILSEDNLKYYVLQYYEDFQELAVKGGELHAAATLYREAADFARRHNLPYERYYRFQAAATHAAAADETLRDDGSVELAENAYSAAIEAFNELGAYTKVRETYETLSRLPLSEKRSERYQRLAARLASVPDETGQLVTFPDYLRMDTAYPEIWRLDVIEWEQGGDPAETMGEVLLDPKWPDFTRRRALLCRLSQLGAGEPILSTETLVALAMQLGRVEIYASLAPLEAMADHEAKEVRAAALKAVRQLFFKRSFVLVSRGLEDEDETVRREALQAVAALHFGHAFDPLARIYRGSSDETVRRTALESIGKIPSVDAAEMLIDVLRHGDKNERDLVRRLLAQADHPEVQNLLRRAAASEAGVTREAIEQVLRARGG
jgi:HEAT repeat protein